MSIRSFAALCLFAAVSAATEENEKKSESTMEQEEASTNFWDSSKDTLSNQMISYEFNGYDWPLTCKTGTEQSPINLHSGFASANTSLAIRAKAFEKITIGKVRRTATNIAMDIPTGQFDIIDPMGAYTEYDSWEAVIKSPSEHTVDGLTYDAELQLMFKKKGGASKNEVAGVSIFFDGTSGGRMTNEFIDSLNLEKTEANDETAEDLQKGDTWDAKNVDVPALLEKMGSSTYWSYQGSLTQPPCTEGVRWTIFEQVQPLKQEQALALRAHYNYNKNWQGYPNGNNRGQQPLNRRFIYYGGAQALVAGAAALAVAALF